MIGEEEQDGDEYNEGEVDESEILMTATSPNVDLKAKKKK